MPPAVWAAGITAGAQVGNALVQNNIANRAQKAQTSAGKDALSFERERYRNDVLRLEEDRRREQERYDEYQRQQEPFRRARLSVLARYGITPNAPPTTAPPGWEPPMSGGPRFRSRYSSLEEPQPEATPALTPPSVYGLY